MQLARRREQLRPQLAQWRRAGETVALVPTMGALHEGHLALVRCARTRARRTVVSIFVNPAQFGPGEDFHRYPRDEAGDLAKLAALGVDLVYLPDAADMYAPDHRSWVVVEELSEGLCGASRPSFFRGVATVVLKLLLRVRPDLAVFGEKDYQQLLVVRRMVRDLDLDLEVVAHPVVREPDGLALSSRNAYLSPEERRIAPALYRSLCWGRERLLEGAAAEAVCAAIAARLVEAGFRAVDYVELRDAEGLRPLCRFDGRPARLLAAAFLGTTRLIDNLPLSRPA